MFHQVIETFSNVYRFTAHRGMAETMVLEEPLLPSNIKSSSGVVRSPTSTTPSAREDGGAYLFVESDSESTSSSSDGDDVEDDTNYSKNTNLNRTRIGGGLWISNSQLLCLVMALDIMTMSVQVRLPVDRKLQIPRE